MKITIKLKKKLKYSKILSSIIFQNKTIKNKIYLLYYYFFIKNNKTMVTSTNKLTLNRYKTKLISSLLLNKDKYLIQNNNTNYLNFFNNYNFFSLNTILYNKNLDYFYKNYQIFNKILIPGDSSQFNKWRFYKEFYNFDKYNKNLFIFFKKNLGLTKQNDYIFNIYNYNKYYRLNDILGPNEFDLEKYLKLDLASYRSSLFEQYDYYRSFLFKIEKYFIKYTIFRKFLLKFIVYDKEEITTEIEAVSKQRENLIELLAVNNPRYITSEWNSIDSWGYYKYYFKDPQYLNNELIMDFYNVETDAAWCTSTGISYNENTDMLYTNFKIKYDIFNNLSYTNIYFTKLFKKNINLNIHKYLNLSDIKLFYFFDFFTLYYNNNSIIYNKQKNLKTLFKRKYKKNIYQQLSFINSYDAFQLNISNLNINYENYNNDNPLSEYTLFTQNEWFNGFHTKFPQYKELFLNELKLNRLANYKFWNLFYNMNYRNVFYLGPMRYYTGFTGVGYAPDYMFTKLEHTSLGNPETELFSDYEESISSYWETFTIEKRKKYTNLIKIFSKSKFKYSFNNIYILLQNNKILYKILWKKKHINNSYSFYKNYLFQNYIKDNEKNLIIFNKENNLYQKENIIDYLDYINATPIYAVSMKEHYTLSNWIKILIWKYKLISEFIKRTKLKINLSLKTKKRKKKNEKKINKIFSKKIFLIFFKYLLKKIYFFNKNKIIPKSLIKHLFKIFLNLLRIDNTQYRYPFLKIKKFIYLEYNFYSLNFFKEYIIKPPTKEEQVILLNINYNKNIYKSYVNNKLQYIFGYNSNIFLHQNHILFIYKNILKKYLYINNYSHKKQKYLSYLYVIQTFLTKNPHATYYIPSNLTPLLNIPIIELIHSLLIKLFDYTHEVAHYFFGMTLVYGNIFYHYPSEIYQAISFFLKNKLNIDIKSDKNFQFTSLFKIKNDLTTSPKFKYNFIYGANYDWNEKISSKNKVFLYFSALEKDQIEDFGDTMNNGVPPLSLVKDTSDVLEDICIPILVNSIFENKQIITNYNIYYYYYLWQKNNNYLEIKLLKNFILKKKEKNYFFSTFNNLKNIQKINQKKKLYIIYNNKINLNFYPTINTDINQIYNINYSKIINWFTPEFYIYNSKFKLINNLKYYFNTINYFKKDRFILLHILFLISIIILESMGNLRELNLYFPIFQDQEKVHNKSLNSFISLKQIEIYLNIILKKNELLNDLQEVFNIILNTYGNPIKAKLAYHNLNKMIITWKWQKKNFILKEKLTKINIKEIWTYLNKNFYKQNPNIFYNIQYKSQLQPIEGDYFFTHWNKIFEWEIEEYTDILEYSNKTEVDLCRNIFRGIGDYQNLLDLTLFKVPVFWSSFLNYDKDREYFQANIYFKLYWKWVERKLLHNIDVRATNLKKALKKNKITKEDYDKQIMGLDNEYEIATTKWMKNKNYWINSTILEWLDFNIFDEHLIFWFDMTVDWPLYEIAQHIVERLEEEEGQELGFFMYDGMFRKYGFLISNINQNYYLKKIPYPFSEMINYTKHPFLFRNYTYKFPDSVDCGIYFDNVDFFLNKKKKFSDYKLFKKFDILNYWTRANVKGKYIEGLILDKFPRRHKPKEVYKESVWTDLFNMKAFIRDYNKIEITNKIHLIKKVKNKKNYELFLLDNLNKKLENKNFNVFQIIKEKQWSSTGKRYFNYSMNEINYLIQNINSFKNLNIVNSVFFKRKKGIINNFIKIDNSWEKSLNLYNFYPYEAGLLNDWFFPPKIDTPWERSRNFNMMDHFKRTKNLMINQKVFFNVEHRLYLLKKFIKKMKLNNEEQQYIIKKFLNKYNMYNYINYDSRKFFFINTENNDNFLLNTSLHKDYNFQVKKYSHIYNEFNDLLGNYYFLNNNLNDKYKFFNIFYNTNNILFKIYYWIFDIIFHFTLIQDMLQETDDYLYFWSDYLWWWWLDYFLPYVYFFIKTTIQNILKLIYLDYLIVLIIKYIKYFTKYFIYLINDSLLNKIYYEFHIYFLIEYIKYKIKPLLKNIDINNFINIYYYLFIKIKNIFYSSLNINLITIYNNIHNIYNNIYNNFYINNKIKTLYYSLIKKNYNIIINSSSNSNININNYYNYYKQIIIKYINNYWNYYNDHYNNFNNYLYLHFLKNKNFEFIFNYLIFIENHFIEIFNYILKIYKYYEKNYKNELLKLIIFYYNYILTHLNLPKNIYLIVNTTANSEFTPMTRTYLFSALDMIGFDKENVLMYFMIPKLYINNNKLEWYLYEKNIDYTLIENLFSKEVKTKITNEKLYDAILKYSVVYLEENVPYQGYSWDIFDTIYIQDKNLQKKLPLLNDYLFYKYIWWPTYIIRQKWYEKFNNLLIIKIYKNIYNFFNANYMYWYKRIYVYEWLGIEFYPEREILCVHDLNKLWYHKLDENEDWHIISNFSDFYFGCDLLLYHWQQEVDEYNLNTTTHMLYNFWVIKHLNLFIKKNIIHFIFAIDSYINYFYINYFYINYFYIKNIKINNLNIFYIFEFFILQNEKIQIYFLKFLNYYKKNFYFLFNHLYFSFLEIINFYRKYLLLIINKFYQLIKNYIKIFSFISDSYLKYINFFFKYKTIIYNHLINFLNIINNYIIYSKIYINIFFNKLILYYNIIINNYLNINLPKIKILLALLQKIKNLLLEIFIMKIISFFKYMQKNYIIFDWYIKLSKILDNFILYPIYKFLDNFYLKANNNNKFNKNLIIENKLRKCDAAYSYQWDFQDPASEIMEGIIDLHHDLMFILIIIIGYILWFFISILKKNINIHNKNNIKVNFTKNYNNIINNSLKKKKEYNEIEYIFLEIFWTLIPIMILILILLPSLTLLYASDETSVSDATIKIFGNQWYWTYNYVTEFDNEFWLPEYSLEYIHFSSYLILDNDLLKGGFRLLETDSRLFIPTKSKIRFLVTSNDVLHSWAIPSLGIKIDACPGRLNQVQIFTKRLGTLYGQCSEICGINHAFMPICVEVLTQDEYAEFIKKATKA